MWYWSLALRLLLALAFALDGSTSAVAGARMAAADAMQASMSARGPGSLHADACAGHSEGGHAVDHTDDHPAAGPASPHDRSTPDCCKGGACQCACTHATHALAAGIAVVPRSIQRARVLNLAAANPPAPALPHLIRPPIG
jgi:hypothetical protein